MPGTGPRLPFLNGSGATLVSSAAVIALLANDFDLVAHDQRGLGRTSIPPDPYTMSDYANDAIALLDHVGWETCRIVGISCGGMVAQELADGGARVGPPGRDRSRRTRRVDNRGAARAQRVAPTEPAAARGRGDPQAGNGFLRDGEDEVIAHCARMMAAFKVPRAVYAVRELRRSTLRKVNKVELRKVLDASDAGLLEAEERWVASVSSDPSADAAL